IAAFFSHLYKRTTSLDEPVDADLAHAYVGPTTLGDPLTLPNALVDIIWLLDQHTDHTDGKGPAMSQRERLMEISRALIAKNFIPVVMMKERLEESMLQGIGLVTELKIFQRKVIRANTALLYKQVKFNLLREETEGFSKLLVELLNSLPALLDPNTHRITHEEATERRARMVNERVEVAVRNVKSLIGTFDLDPNRVLDLVLDLFLANVSDHWDFFVALIEACWPPHSVEKPGTARPGDTAPPPPIIVLEPRQVVGQTLGFKFSSYNNPDSNSTPAALSFVAAVLIKHKLVDILHLYPHLGPSDDAIPEEYEEYLKKITKKAAKSGKYSVQGAFSSPLDRGGSTSSLPPPPQSDRRNGPTPAPLSNQKAELAAALLAIGDIPHARFILDRLPTLSRMHPDIAINFCRLLQVMVDPLYRLVHPLAKAKKRVTQKLEECRAPSNTITTRSCLVFEHPHVGRSQLHAPRYRFFYGPWKDALTTVTDTAYLTKVLRVNLSFVGPHLYRDPILLGRIIAIGRAELEKNAADPAVKAGWLHIIAPYILPALSQTDSNSFLSNEIWSLIRFFPTATRYALYGEWRSKTYKDIPELKVAIASTEKDIRALLGRLSKESIRQSGRQIAKSVHSNPVLAYDQIINQLQSYDNMISFIVDASRYMTDLEFDVLSFCLIDALADSRNRLRNQNTGTNIAAWLKSLSTFSGTLFRKHPSMELAGILRYIACQLVGDSIYDLVLLQDIVSSMSGLKIVEDATDDQLHALAGGDTLRREVFVFESLRAVRRSAHRLASALIDTGYASKIPIMVASMRQQAIHVDANRDLKVTAWTHDYCQRTLTHYIDFLSSTIGSAEYEKIMPDISVLCLEFGLDPPAAFQIARPRFASVMKVVSCCIGGDSTGPTELSTVGDQSAGAPTPMDTDPPTAASAAAPSFPPMSSDPDSRLVDPSTNPVWHPGLHSTIRAVVPLLPAKAWHGISPYFYVTFWQLTLYDVFVPTERYEAEISRQTKLVTLLENDRSPDSGTRRKKEKEKALTNIRILKAERVHQEENHKKVLKRLKAESEYWFATSRTRNDIISSMIQYCVYPRSILSPTDAMYCAKFILLMHSIGTRNIPSVSLYDRIMNRDSVYATILAATENGAKHYGGFHAIVDWIAFWEFAWPAGKSCKRAVGAFATQF
ncbi:transcription factor/nuclear export subunit protein 2-domain-containing protein, partial [Blyttiomyces helicus]